MDKKKSIPTMYVVLITIILLSGLTSWSSSFLSLVLSRNNEFFKLDSLMFQ